MNTPENHRDAQLARRARELHVRAARQLDPATAGRLRAARREALEGGATPARPGLSARLLLPVGALAAIALATLMVWQPRPAAPGIAQDTAASIADNDTDVPPDADNVDPKLYQNLDFYGWLASNDTGAGAHAPVQ